MIRPRVPALLAALSLLAACHLVDQRDFDPNAGKRPVPPAPVAGKAGPPPAPPLMTIRFDQGAQDYDDALRVAVDAALRRKRNVLFSVITLVPAQGSPSEQIETARRASELGRQVADAIVADGADIGQVEMAARADPSVAAREVRIYVQ
ncbi:MAG TPA: hypothetical protein VMI52_10160 [Acetobacteraceae bacterium]|nr:hypothetical protein [Acetobacteraceae bacterium]